MERPRIRFWFDYVDPLSYLQNRALQEALQDAPTTEVERIPLELRPPPAPLLDPDGAWWQDRWSQATEVAQDMGVRLVHPAIIPWTRKAHELVVHAREAGLAQEAHDAVFEAFFLRGLDIGRVDILVDMAVALGLDLTHTKAVLDVDRYASALTGMEATGDDKGEPPTLVIGASTLQGFHNRDALRTFLG